MKLPLTMRLSELSKFTNKKNEYEKLSLSLSLTHTHTKFVYIETTCIRLYKAVISGNSPTGAGRPGSMPSTVEGGIPPADREPDEEYA